METIMHEYNGALAYVQEMQRESRRRATVRSQRRELRHSLDEDCCDTRIRAHLSRRLESEGKDKWIRMLREADGYSKAEKERMKDYLLEARSELAKTTREHKRFTS